MPTPPWSLHTGVDAVVERWTRDPRRAACFTADRELPPQAGRYAPYPEDLHPRLTAAFRERGIEQLYAHQREAIDRARSGAHVVIATPTASGKSLCFHLPVFDAIARDPGATALYLYPTKALSRDQEQSVLELVAAAGLPIAATVYDGDTPGDARRAAKQRAQLIMTNPDMLHAGILPQHAGWARLMQNLRYVIVDELHTYRGVFGSHVAHVLQRLRRVAQFHGADPTFICATATIANPVEHASRILGVEADSIALIAESTAPRGSRRVFIYAPPIVNAELGIRASYLKSAVSLTADLLKARVPTILFGQSRNAVEIMLKYLRDRFASEPAVSKAIVAYRGGYLPERRRQVERGLRDGDILCVVATSALELGIDIGDLEAAVCAGYPGSLAETWQRFGRAGRRSSGSLAVLVASSAPIDQYIASHPELLLDGTIEQARIDPSNTEIVIQHLKCAAFELPFRGGEDFSTLRRGETEAALDFLAGHGVVHRSRDRYHWSTDSFPANHVSLRSVGWDNFVIIERPGDDALAELDWHSTPSMLHEQAIYQHDGLQYQVEELDYENHKAYVRRVEPDYFTIALRNVKVRVLEDEAEAGLGQGARTGWSEVCVTEKVVGYKKVKFHTHENAGYGDVRLPDIDKHTTSFWLTVPAALCAEVGRARAIEGLRGLGHALELVATVALMCDSRDIGRALEDATPVGAPAGETESGDAGPGGDVDEDDSSNCDSSNCDSSNCGAHAEQFSATIYLYDVVPGGVGLAERIHERAATLTRQASELIASCACALGCPSCVGATALAAAGTATPAPTAIDRKSAAIALARRLGLLSQPPGVGDGAGPVVLGSSRPNLQLVP